MRDRGNAEDLAVTVFHLFASRMSDRQIADLFLAALSKAKNLTIARPPMLKCVSRMELAIAITKLYAT